MATLVLGPCEGNQPKSSQHWGPPAKELRLAGKGVLPLGRTHTHTHIRSRTSLLSTCHESAQCVLQAIVSRRAPLSNIEMHAGAALGARPERQVAPFCALDFFLLLGLSVSVGCKECSPALNLAHLYEPGINCHILYIAGAEPSHVSAGSPSTSLSLVNMMCIRLNLDDDNIDQASPILRSRPHAVEPSLQKRPVQYQHRSRQC